ncbi:MAG: 4-(cytidine 5'-diphospho)-2-C-methyl-D-erythritol kinase [bacterium]
MKVLAPAKINLYLKISGKRPDGFHELETLMCPVDLADELELELAEDGIHLEVKTENGDVLSSGPENLVWRAAQAVQERAGIKAGVRIILHKRIPMGGGLAGGSSDAAATLLVMNKLWNAGLDNSALAELAASLGSDVCFFLQPHPAVCTGRGEKIRPIELKNLPWAVLINPGFSVPTPWAYKAYAMNPNQGVEGKTLDWTASGITLRNDLEPAVFSKYLWIKEAKAWLQKQDVVLDALMSGSGASVFALVSDEKAGRQLAERASDYFGRETWIRVVCPLTKPADKLIR